MTRQIEISVAKWDLIKVCSEELIQALSGGHSTPKDVSNFRAVIGELSRVYDDFSCECIEQLRTSAVCRARTALVW